MSQPVGPVTCRVTAVQMDPKLARTRDNLDRIAAGLRDAGGGLVVFPEAALQGYGYDSLDDARRVAETVPGPSSDAVAAACREARAWAVFGMLERAGERVFNSAVLVGPDGVGGVYRKMHLPFLGVDRFATPGDRGFPVFETPLARIGILICYDLSFPEAARILKLSGAQIVVVPTNWPEAATVSCHHAPMVRAQENHVHVVTCDRVGEEAGFTFLGGSRIVDCSGRVLAEAGRGEEVVSAELDPGAADRNRIVNVAGRYELDRIGHRRPEWYARIVDRR